MASDIRCDECGHAFPGERVATYAEQLQIPTMLLRARLRQLGCYALGTRHLVTGLPGPVREIRMTHETDD